MVANLRHKFDILLEMAALKAEYQISLLSSL